MSLSHLKITQAGLVALATTFIGQIVAFVPSLAPDQQVLISGVSGAISAAFLIANAVHKLADSNVSAKDVEAGALAAVRAEVSKVNFNQIAADAVSGQNLPALAESLVKTEVTKLLGQLAQAQAPSNVTPITAAPSATSSPVGPGPVTA